MLNPTELKTPFIFSSNTHLFKGTEGHFYQFWKKHLIFWVITNLHFYYSREKPLIFWVITNNIEDNTRITGKIAISDGHSSKYH